MALFGLLTHDGGMRQGSSCIGHRERQLTWLRNGALNARRRGCSTPRRAVACCEGFATTLPISFSIAHFLQHCPSISALPISFSERDGQAWAALVIRGIFRCGCIVASCRLDLPVAPAGKAGTESLPCGQCIGGVSTTYGWQ